ncbi:MMPL family protein [Paenibacillus pectinilyticus]|uniref:MMPL family protein n=1 Tax=Paenibacillus pectinilyticus TaxID=512399 RepID=A0A1C1A5H0_9BACL|nr:MMPL family protein [Paenibacillus pectinilyticus]
MQKLSMLSIRYPKLILCLWILFFLYFGFFAPRLPSVLKDHGLISDGTFAQVEQRLSADFHIPDHPVILVFEKKTSLAPKKFQSLIQQEIWSLRGMEGLREIISPLENEGMIQGNFAYVLLGFNQNPYEMKPVLHEIQTRLPSHRDLTVRMTGKSVVQEDVNRASQHDLRKAESLGLPAAFLILWIAFGGLASALIPIIVGIIGVAGSMGIMYWIGTRIDLSNFVLNVIPMVGLALSIDFALMMVSRFREEIHAGPVGQALLVTMQTAGRAVLFSALSVFLGLMGILFIPLPIFSTIALGAMTVLAVSVLLTLTLVPALLKLWWPAILAERKPHVTPSRRNVWLTIAHLVMRRPVQMSVLATCILLCCILPLSKMKIVIPDATSLPQDYESRIAYEDYQAHFGSQTGTDVYLIMQGKSASLSRSDWMNAAALIAKVERDPLVEGVTSLFSTLRMTTDQLYPLSQNPSSKAKYERVWQSFVHNNEMLVQFRLKGESSSPEVMDWLRRWEREGTSSAALPFLLGGEAKYQQEIFDDIFDNIPKVLLFILVSNYIILFMAFRSVLIPLKTILMNLLSLGASFGILAWLFQEGHLGLEPSRIAIMIPVFIFGLAFGISMDYGVFLVSRIYEEYQRTGDNHRAVLIGLGCISKIINSAAAIMIAVTLPFAFGDVVGVKQLGIGIAAAIFIDATVIRLMLVPALMVILGKWNWWGPHRGRTG